MLIRDVRFTKLFYEFPFFFFLETQLLLLITHIRKIKCQFLLANRDFVLVDLILEWQFGLVFLVKLIYDIKMCI